MRFFSAITKFIGVVFVTKIVIGIAVHHVFEKEGNSSKLIAKNTSNSKYIKKNQY